MPSGRLQLRYAPSVLRKGVLVALVLAVGCGGAAKGPVVAAAPHEAAHTPRRIPLAYSLRGRNFPLPIAKVTVGGVPSLALVDTGANSHVIAGWLARKAKLSTASMGDVGVDHAGHSIDTRRAPHPSIVVEGWGELADAETLVTDVPDAIARLGIGLFLSPQQLASPGTPVVFDLQERELRESAGDDDLEETVRGLVKLTTKPARGCIDDDSAVPSRAYVVSAQINGLAAELLLDTGAARTDLLVLSSAGKALLPKSEPNKEPIYAASGAVTSRTSRAALVEVGDVHRTVDVDLLPGKLDPFCPRDGVLAMDVLASCALVFETNDVRVFCKEVPGLGTTAEPAKPPEPAKK